MSLTILNLVDSLALVNFGVWNAAISTAPLLSNDFGIRSEVWTPIGQPIPELVSDQVAEIRMIENSDALLASIAAQGTANNQRAAVVAVSHGAWRLPTRWGRLLRRQGIPWVYTPQGMLEPWSLTQKKIRKAVYFHSYEKRAIQSATVIRAVSVPEQENLAKLLGHPDLVHIPNGIPEVSPVSKSDEDQRTFLFLGRLHHKKGVLPMVRAFAELIQSGRKNCRLLVVGPDDGQLEALRQQLGATATDAIQLVGPAYGEHKEALLRQAHFFILPSHSEGFPTSVVEAMGYGCVPLISDGCNFPESFEAGLSISAEPSKESILAALQTAMSMDSKTLQSVSEDCHRFIKRNYFLDQIAAQQATLYHRLLKASENKKTT